MLPILLYVLFALFSIQQTSVALTIRENPAPPSLKPVLQALKQTTCAVQLIDNDVVQIPESSTVTVDQMDTISAHIQKMFKKFDKAVAALRNHGPLTDDEFPIFLEAQRETFGAMNDVTTHIVDKKYAFARFPNGLPGPSDPPSEGTLFAQETLDHLRDAVDKWTAEGIAQTSGNNQLTLVNIARVIGNFIFLSRGALLRL